MRFISSSYIILALDGFGYIHGKGLAVIGGKGNREVCPDCPDNYNAEELTWALVTLAIVTGLFLSICFCRFYPKIRQLFSSELQINTKPCQCSTIIHRGSNATIKPITSPSVTSPETRLHLGYPHRHSSIPKTTRQQQQQQQQQHHQQQQQYHHQKRICDKNAPHSASTPVFTSHI